jgi:hypothetical protein
MKLPSSERSFIIVRFEIHTTEKLVIPWAFIPTIRRAASVKPQETHLHVNDHLVDDRFPTGWLVSAG